jgi:hypothetical protein
MHQQQTVEVIFIFDGDDQSQRILRQSTARIELSFSTQLRNG